MADHQQLGIVAELLQQAQEPVQVHVVEGCLHLVHHVEGRRATPEDSEQECQGRQRPLTTGEQRQLLHVLAGGSGLDLQTGLEQVVRICQAETPLAAREQGLEQVGEV